MVVFPSCKINIGLNIVGKREDGFHNLQSVFFPLPFTDSLEIIQSEDQSFTSFGRLIPGKQEDNLINRAYAHLNQRFGLDPVSISLLKNIPMGGGLGGGSANGAFALSALNSLFELGLSIRELESVSAELGSDCPFFIKNVPAYVTGRGEFLEPIELDLSGKTIALIFTPIHISTKEAFSGMLIQKNAPDLLTEIQKPIESWNEGVTNDFEQTVFPIYHELGRIKKALYEGGASYASMTGTGSTVYGIFNSKPTLDQLDLPENCALKTISI